LRNPELREPEGFVTTPDNSGRVEPADDILFLAGGAVVSLTKLGARAAYGAARSLAGESISTIEADASSQAAIRNAARSIEEFLGGKGLAKSNKAGDIVILRGNKKIRFDIKNPGRKLKNQNQMDQPHFHLQELKPNGKWKNLVKHRLYFRGRGQ